MKSTETAARHARGIALDVLRRVEAEGAYADAVLGHELSNNEIDRRDRGLVTQLVYGTIAWQGYLDHVIAAFSRRPPAELDTAVRLILRLALFQITKLDRIPTFAAVTTAVDLAKQVCRPAAGLINAVLRRAASKWPDVPLPSRQRDPVGYLALRWSHPRWLVEQWVAQYGAEDAEALLRANNAPAGTLVRVNTVVNDRAAWLARLHDGATAAEPTVYSPVGVRLLGAGAADEVPGYADGAFTMQGEASQLISFIMGVDRGARVLDACAAPGGKTTHVAELAGETGRVLALDRSPRGAARIRALARRLHLERRVHAIAADAARPLPLRERFPHVLVDAPCSGLGTLRQHPEVRWRRTPDDLPRLAAVQSAIVQQAARWVAPGGVLVYATCTLSRVENDGVIDAFLAAAPRFRADDPRPFLPAVARPLVGDDLRLRTSPHHHGLDGFFAARLKAIT